ncbi:MAG: tyrosine-type recombinase/integrase [Planctomycetes bacterium]|nr:tyrosine-type recombinase/integrase [Planctomycetota bacterium]
MSFANPQSGLPYTESVIDFAFRSTVKKAGLMDFHFHDLRHDLATNLYRETHDLQAVQKVLGHSVVTTSARYAHVVQADVDAAMNALDKPKNVHITSTWKAATGTK